MNKRTLLMVFGLSVVFYTINNLIFPSKAAQVETKNVTDLKSAPTTTTSQDKYYVLENETAQLVFSTRGGALSEINLPLYSDTNKESIVRPIEFDKDLNTQSPENQKFPLYPSYTYSNKGTLERKESSQGGCYPLIRRSLITTGAQPVNPHYYAGAIGYMDGRGTDTVYSVKKISKNSIQLEGQFDGKVITKTFTFLPEAPYCFEMSIQVQGDTSGLYLFSGIPEVEITSGSSNPTLKYLVRKNKGHSVEKVSLPKETNTLSSINPTWVSTSNGYLGVIMNPLESSKNGFTMTKVEGIEVPTRLSLIDPKYNPYPAKKYPGYLNSIPLSFENSQAKVRFFAGPYEDDLLKSLDKTFAKTSYNPYFIRAMSLHGWFTFISEPF